MILKLAKSCLKKIISYKPKEQLIIAMVATVALAVWACRLLAS